ncbi:MAG: glycosyltransferase [Bdellovibrionales bacterium]
MSQNNKPLIILSTGGTGGHIIPAQALATELLKKGYAVEVITDSRGMKFTKGFGGIPIHQISAGTFGKGLPKLILGLLQSMILLIKNRPDCVIGFGGYPSFPGILAAQILCIPNILHESNAIFGKANKALGCLATKISLSWNKTQGLSKKEQSKSQVIGNPIREDIAVLASTQYPDMNETLNILVMGGSLGATVFSEVLPKSFTQLSHNQKSKLKIIQQCREADIQAVRKAYKKANIDAELATFIDDVPEALKNCHLFIGRSGGTVFEITAAGRPAIYVPYPHHADQQQKINADAIAEKGGAWTIEEKDFTPEVLKEKIELFLADPSTLKTAAGKAKTCGTPDAASKLADMIEPLVNVKI